MALLVKHLIEILSKANPEAEVLLTEASDADDGLNLFEPSVWGDPKKEWTDHLNEEREEEERPPTPPEWYPYVPEGRFFVICWDDDYRRFQFSEYDNQDYEKWRVTVK